MRKISALGPPSRVVIRSFVTHRPAWRPCPLRFPLPCTMNVASACCQFLVAPFAAMACILKHPNGVNLGNLPPRQGPHDKSAYFSNVFCIISARPRIPKLEPEIPKVDLWNVVLARRSYVSVRNNDMTKQSLIRRLGWGVAWVTDSRLTHDEFNTTTSYHCCLPQLRGVFREVFRDVFWEVFRYVFRQVFRKVFRQAVREVFREVFRKVGCMKNTLSESNRFGS